MSDSTATMSNDYREGDEDGFTESFMNECDNDAENAESFPRNDDNSCNR